MQSPAPAPAAPATPATTDSAAAPATPATPATPLAPPLAPLAPPPIVPPAPHPWLLQYRGSPAGADPSELKAHSLLNVPPGTPEYNRVARLVERDGFEVEAVERNVNPCLKETCDKMRVWLRRHATVVDPATQGIIKRVRAEYGWHTPHPGYEDNEALLFHKTMSDLRNESILEMGMSGCYGSQSGMFGKGLYFSDTLRKAHAYGIGNKVLLCRVVLGDCAKVERFGSAGLGVALSWDGKSAPVKHDCQRRFRGDLFYNSWMGLRDGFNEFIVCNDAQVYPLYLVTYRTTPTFVDAPRVAPSFVLGCPTSVDPAEWGNLVVQADEPDSGGAGGAGGAA